MSKLGIIAIEWHDDALQWAIQNKPTAFEFMLTRPLDDPKKRLLRELAVASPKTLLVVRAYPDDYDHPDFQDRMLRWSEPFREISDRVVAHSINEPVVFNAEDAKRLNEYEIGFIERMAAEGLIPMCFCLSESHLAGPTLEDGKVKDWGNLPLWGHMWRGIARLGEVSGFLGFNEYDWPDWNTSRDGGQKWRLGHWELNLEFIRKVVDPSRIPMVGIGEGILDGKIWTSRLPKDDPRHGKPWGYRKIKRPTSLFSEIEGIEEDSYCKRDVAFNLMFAWAPGHPHWNSYDISVAAGVLATHLHHSPPQYWEPKEEPMEVWENVEKHRPDVAKFAHEVGRATREYPVPIADYEGQPVSPGKVMAVIIANEKNPCDPNFVNEFDEKDEDGKPTGRKLHAVGLCGVVAEHTGYTIEELKEPLRNIRTGLSILEGKLQGVQRNIREAYYYYTGGSHWESKEWWHTTIWLNRFCSKYSLFWGVDLEPGDDGELQKKYEDLRNGVVAAINTLQGVLDA